MQRTAQRLVRRYRGLVVGEEADVVLAHGNEGVILGQLLAGHHRRHVGGQRRQPAPPLLVCAFIQHTSECDSY